MRTNSEKKVRIVRIVRSSIVLVVYINVHNMSFLFFKKVEGSKVGEAIRAVQVWGCMPTL